MISDLILHYKSQILSYLEYRTCAVTHAADSHLTVLDSVQRRFLQNISLNQDEAFQDYNLAPLSSRRDIANLGLIYRAILRQGPRQLRDLFQLDHSAVRSSPRFVKHLFQVVDATRDLHREYLDRSTFGYVAIFNLLPPVMFHSQEYDQPIPVKEFQRNLTKLLRLSSHVEVFWPNLFNPRFELHNHLIRDFHNVSFEHL